MDWKKILKYIYGAGDSSHGNIGVLPEKGKGPSYPPKLQTKMHVDINGKEHDMDEYNSGWVMRTSRVRYELRKHVNEDRKQAVSFRRHLRMNENIENMFKELKCEFPEDFGSYDGLTVDALDFKGNYDEYTDFDETLLFDLEVCYKDQTITIKRYYKEIWEIEDENYIKSEYFREIGKILSIVMKHISKIKLD